MQKWFISGKYVFLGFLVILGSLSKHEIGDSENIIWKCNFAFLQSFLYYSKSLHLCINYPVIKLEQSLQQLNWNNRFSGKKTKLNFFHAHVVHATTKQVISCSGNNENVFETYRNETCTCKACKTIVLHFQIWKFVTFLLPSSSCLLKLPTVFPSKELLLYGLVTKALFAFWPFDVLWVSSNEHSQRKFPGHPRTLQ